MSFFRLARLVASVASCDELNDERWAWAGEAGEETTSMGKVPSVRVEIIRQLIGLCYLLLVGLLIVGDGKVRFGKIFCSHELVYLMEN